MPWETWVVLGLGERWALMLRTAWVVVRRAVRMSSPPDSTVMACSATCTVTARPGVDPAEGDLLPDDHDDAGVAGAGAGR
jgi:hypothetical protein